jgi:hypothetical protein
MSNFKHYDALIVESNYDRMKRKRKNKKIHIILLIATLMSCYYLYL